MSKPKLLIKLIDGRIGIGYAYKYKGKLYYHVKGFGFDVDNFELKDIFEIVKVGEVFTQ